MSTTFDLYYPVCGMVNIKRLFATDQKRVAHEVTAAGFVSFIQCHITVNEIFVV